MIYFESILNKKDRVETQAARLICNNVQKECCELLGYCCDSPYIYITNKQHDNH